MTSLSRRRTLFALGALPLSLALAACSKESTSAYKQPIPAMVPLTAQTLDDIERLSASFTYKGGLSVRKVYVFFDPQCPHCGLLWGQMEALRNQAQFIWIPVSLMGEKSVGQGVALLRAEDPVKAMHIHKTSLMARTGGISVGGGLTAEYRAKIEQNTEILRKLGATGVPFVVGEHAVSRNIIKFTGSSSAAEFARNFGWTL